MSLFSPGTRPNLVRHKSVVIFPDQSSNPFNTSAYGPFVSEVTLAGVGRCTRLLISFPTIYKNYINPGVATQSSSYYSSVAKALYKDYADKYRFWRISGFKVKFYPKYNVAAVPVATTVGQAPSIAGTSYNLDVPIMNEDGYENPLVSGLYNFYPPALSGAARKSIGFAAPFLGVSSHPFVSLTENDLMKYMNSNFKKIVFNGKYQSIYYKCYRGTADTISGSIAPDGSGGSTTTSQILVGWRPCVYSETTGFAQFDEQGLAILCPFNYRDLNTRYTISVTTYFKFLYEKGPRVSNVDEPS